MNNAEKYVSNGAFFRLYETSLRGLMSNLTIEEIYQIASDSPQEPDLKKLIVKASLNLTCEAIQQLEDIEPKFDSDYDEF